ncbi:MAG: HPr family phosphocarrier protein [Verrucomicrobia bacterium]|nr:HPr family phosphocarrier protein [Verrucomicrobiota bacterium]MCH8512039.1 HPr family phosphocarrier protein [Kiritimatiellia bacterium]
MIAKSLCFKHPAGLHLRVASKIIQLSDQSGVKIRVVRNDTEQEAFGDSIISFMMLDVGKDSELLVFVEGPEEQTVFQQIERLFIDGAGAESPC